jgi:hypothetical protein
MTGAIKMAKLLEISRAEARSMKCASGAKHREGSPMIAKSSRRERPFERLLRREAEFLAQMRAKANETTDDYHVKVHKHDLQLLVRAAERDAKRRSDDRRAMIVSWMRDHRKMTRAASQLGTKVGTSAPPLHDA